MQPFTFDFVRVGIRDPRMTAIAGLRFQTLLGERPFTGADRSLARKSASDAFGSVAGLHQQRLSSPRIHETALPESWHSSAAAYAALLSFKFAGRMTAMEHIAVIQFARVSGS
jgi:hypothetical protein